MSKLEDLVPPLELCKRIPAGKFEDSALVYIYWWKSPTKAIEIRVRYEVESDPEFDDLVEDERIIIYPAPTLAEILEKLPKSDYDEHVLYCVPDYPDKGKCRIFGCVWSIGHGNNTFTEANPATAALRLWLDVNGVEVKDDER
jgi:hypothetical protein